VELASGKVEAKNFGCEQIKVNSRVNFHQSEAGIVSPTSSIFIHNLFPQITITVAINKNGRGIHATCSGALYHISSVPAFVLVVIYDNFSQN
jgi:hypothetical protein